MKERYLIELRGERYEVKREGGNRLIKAAGDWLDPIEFTQWLIDNEKIAQFIELASLGHTVIMEHAKDN